jgi:lipoprotein-anchoring transpeptidase ErfK/SrfK
MSVFEGMLNRKFRVVFAAAAAAVSVMGATQAAQAQDLIDFLWGGEEEFGGAKRQNVTFSTQFKPGQIVVSFGDRRLYLVTKEGQAISYPIAIPREQDHWSGNTTVSQKRENPSWTPTPTMLKENPRLPSWVPGGHPMNPLGVRALYLGSSTYRIHGTDAPWTIGQAVSKGCIRMFNEDVLDLYPRVPVGAKVLVTWDQFKTGAAPAETASAPASSSSSSSKPKPTSSKSSGPESFSSLFGYSDDDAAPQPAEKTTATTTKFGRKVGGGQVSKASQKTAQN